ncbi:glutamate--tRNA ligase [Polymorphum gilvum]|uniref:Glutamate--tRNA ligase n=1 Tax=Polymorphum gilvum (strain LMG 25793 / CGMCC 1.9160 / SL003B-26A1) TaxID=991905 RepID=F2J5B1_POLGS|nr:glutamate--tRNA ligase [Polymorphum gilvum]ADZ71170.1 Glutamyl-tRNA synthetase 1 [Polymorphum gilvum SL003B-26A1]
MTVTVRFAPSPTGHIHIGNSRTALFNWLFARRSGGRFVLRFDDTDTERSREDFARSIEADLAWLGITPDRIERQSQRVALYDAAAHRLRDAGLLYPCYETADELERRRARARALGRPPVYDRAALKLGEAQRAALEAEGRRPHWRFLLPNHDGDPFAPHRTEVVWDDLCRGAQAVDLASLSDPVLVREDGSYLYTLPSVVDDIDMAISHVIRGEDHVANTAVQIAILRALGAATPAFAHHNLLTTADGEGLSKRKGALSIGSLREAGLEPMAVASLAVLTGTSHAVEPVADLDALAEMLDLGAVSRSAAKFDPADLIGLNARLVHALSYEAVSDRLSALGVGGGAAFWEAVRENCEKVADAVRWWTVVAGPVEPAIDAADRDYITAARALLPVEPWDEATWTAWTDAVKTETGRKGRALFLPLRKAVTGLDHGPDMKALLPLIGRRNTSDRLA